MLDSLRKLKQEQLLGLMFVLVLHGAGLYALWSYHMIPTPETAVTLMVNLINPPPQEQPKPEQPKPPPPKLRPIDLPKPQQLVAETPVVLPDEPVALAPPPVQVIMAPPLPPQPVMLSSELSVSCPERAPPDYPVQSMRLNEQGRVLLRVELGEDGRVSSVTVKTGSEFPRLDAAAVSAVKAWRCKPAIRNGLAVPAVALQPFNFILEGR